ncbi:MAG: PorT family protein [Prevotellaceae bacterium]|jgi:hypothetical protein|nr:PorT family protein [Prevotellaceae bacterium]
MKNFLLLICLSCIAAGAAAQSVRIGSLEFSVKKNQDTVAQFLPVDCPPCPDENGEAPKKAQFKQFHKSTPFMGIGFIQPNIGGEKRYATMGGKSINLDFGWQHRYQLAKRWAFVGVFHYSYHNYKLRDAAVEPLFVNEVLNGTPYPAGSIAKQVYRTHSVAIGGMLRFYLKPPRRRTNSGLYADVGLQGDYVFSKYFNVYPGDKRRKFHNDYALNAFPGYALARLGWKGTALFCRYRLTDAFNQKVLPMDLPRVTIGIQFL